MTDDHHFGPRLVDGGVRFDLWAPGAKRVDVVTELRTPMHRDAQGWFSATVESAKPGTRYKFRIDDEIEVPDPASRFQPEDVHGPSEVIDPSYAWKNANWRGRPWHECVFTEVHTGTFTPRRNFRDVIDKLDHLASTGFTALELLPVADFPGRWNWGYDGVLLYAPDSSYGRPEDLKALVDAAHARGLMMFLDVVYNHFGPDGNYLGRYAPSFFTKANTPWGSAIDYSQPQVRQFAIENALLWLDEYRFDGLRLDAVHAIAEPERTQMLEELSRRVGALASTTGRHIHLVLENDANQSSLLDPHAKPEAGRYHGQWNDDYHHAFHVALTGERSGYYEDYGDGLAQAARAVGEGFIYQGEPSSHRSGEARGESTAELHPTSFVNFLQNHDQIGNRALGERLTALAEPASVAAALALMLLSPAPPLLFMGEEWGSRQPFPFFCDFKGDLADAVRAGRKREFAAAYAEHSDVPDPLAESTVRLASLDWGEVKKPEYAQRLALVQRLLAVRRERVMPLLPRLRTATGEAKHDEGVLSSVWRTEGRDSLAIVANLSDREKSSPISWSTDVAIWGGPPPSTLPPWSVYAAIGPL